MAEGARRPRGPDQDPSGTPKPAPLNVQWYLFYADNCCVTLASSASAGYTSSSDTGDNKLALLPGAVPSQLKVGLNGLEL